MQTLVSYKNEIQNISLVSTIVFISDLHFDFVEGKFCEARSEETKKMFIAYVKNNYKQSIVCILGDCFNDWKKVLLFIKELEKEGLIVTSNYFVAENGVTRRSRRFSAFIGCLCVHGK